MGWKGWGVDQALNSPRAKWVLPLSLISALALYWALAWFPVRMLVGLSVADDAFYYLTIARHVALGHGATFDGVTLTNGFHPIYLLILSGLFRWMPTDPDFIFHLGLCLLGLSSVITGWILYCLSLKVADKLVATVALLIWLFNPQVILTTLQGVESPLATTALAYVVLLAISNKVAHADPRQGLRASIGIGFTIGVAILCRTDSVLFGGIVGLAVLFTCLRQRGLKTTAIRGALLFGSLLSVLAPWFFWNLAHFGRLSQDSARAISSLRHVKWFQEHALSELPLTIGDKVFQRFSHFGTLLGPGWIGLAFLFLLLVSPFLFRHRPVERATDGRESPRTLARILALGCIAILAFYGGIFWFGQRWYYMTPLFATTGLTAWLFGEASHFIPRHTNAFLGRWVPLFLVATLFLASCWASRSILENGLYPWQKQYWDIAQLLALKLPPEARVGAFNAGIYGYRLDGRVVNLDGVVNGRAYEALRARQLLAFIRSAHLTHLIDHRRTLRTFAWFAEPSYAQALRVVATFPMDTNQSEIVLVEMIKTR